MPVPLIDRTPLLDELSPPPRLLYITAPAGYGKTILARALMARAEASGVCDLSYVATTRELVRSALEALTSGHAVMRENVAEQFLALGDDAASWVRFGQDVFRSFERPTTLCFENGESLAERPELLLALGDLVRGGRVGLNVIVCSRVPLDLEFGRFAGPDVTRVLDATDLRFDRLDMRRIFAETNVTEDQFARVASFSNGWPIVVMMLLRLASHGRLDEHLLEKRDTADLYGYVATEVTRYLGAREREVLAVVAAIPDATERDVIGLFPDCAELLRGLRERTPFISMTAKRTLEVHPAMRDMLLDRDGRTTILKRIFATIERDDGGLRAAQIALHLGSPRDAAEVLVNVGGSYMLTTVGPELNAVVSAIPTDILTEYPELWNVSMLARAFAIDPIAWIDEGERVYAACTPATADDVRGGVAMSLINAYANRGRWREIASFTERLSRDASASFRPVAELIVEYWELITRAYRGSHVDTSLVETRFAPFMANPVTRAVTDYDLIARDHRLRGDRERSRAVLDRAVDLVKTTGIPLAVVVVTLDAAFDAWFFGDDDGFARYLAELEAASVPSVERGIALFLSCAAGEADRAIGGTEKLKTRAYAFVIAATIEREPARRVHYCREAVVAADQADQPFAQALAYTGLALCEATVAATCVAFDRAQRIADATCSPALREAVTATRTGDASTTMFGAFVARFDATERKTSSRRVVIDLAVGTVTIEGVDARLTDREAELVAFLALRGALHPDAIADTIWPDVDGDRALASLKTYVSRLRRAAGDPHFIVREPHRCRLGAAPYIAKGASVATRFTRWRWWSDVS